MWPWPSKKGKEAVEGLNVEVTVAAIDAGALVHLIEALSSAGAAASFADDNCTIP